MSTETEQRLAERINPAAASLITTGKTGALAFGDASQLMEFSKMMAIAQVAIPKHLRGNPGACLAISIQASEWGMSPFAVANKSYSVNDRLAYEAQLINAVILKRAPIQGRFKIEYSGEGQRRKCKVSAVLSDGERVEYESPAIGDIKTQNSPLWKSDPDQQLFYFASRSMCRRHFPDVLLGVYTPDELHELNEREAPKAARAEPLDPFASLPDKAPEVVEADFTEQPADEPNESDLLLTDTIATVGETTDAATLTSLVEDANRNFTGAKQTMLKRAINERAKALGFEWSKQKGGFEKV